MLCYCNSNCNYNGYDPNGIVKDTLDGVWYINIDTTSLYFTKIQAPFFWFVRSKTWRRFVPSFYWFHSAMSIE
jgi:hypothetical protein